MMISAILIVIAIILGTAFFFLFYLMYVRLIGRSVLGTQYYIFRQDGSWKDFLRKCEARTFPKLFVTYFVGIGLWFVSAKLLLPPSANLEVLMLVIGAIFFMVRMFAVLNLSILAGNLFSSIMLSGILTLVVKGLFFKDLSVSLFQPYSIWASVAGYSLLLATIGELSALGAAAYVFAAEMDSGAIYDILKILRSDGSLQQEMRAIAGEEVRRLAQGGQKK